MFKAIDETEQVVWIDEITKGQKYYCPTCHAPLNIRMGECKAHHFAHKNGFKCTDTWNYDMSDWHRDWQALFPIANREIIMSDAGDMHRADIVVDRTVVEFQHSPLTNTEFAARNNFYLSLGYNVVWLFDLIHDYDENRIRIYHDNDYQSISWDYHKKQFDSYNNYDLQTGRVKIFFQLQNTEYDSIVQLRKAETEGFRNFTTSAWLSKNDFLTYVGMENMNFLPPVLLSAEVNPNWISFKDKYHLKVYDDEANAILAPTTTTFVYAGVGSDTKRILAYRIAYLLLVKNIPLHELLFFNFSQARLAKIKQILVSTFHLNLEHNLATAKLADFTTKQCNKNNLERNKYIFIENYQNLSCQEDKVLQLLSIQKSLFAFTDDKLITNLSSHPYLSIVNSIKINYRNPTILYLTHNYLNAAEINVAADRLLDANVKSYSRDIKCENSNPQAVSYHTLPSQEQQYNFLVNRAKGLTEPTAYLCARSESLISLIILLLDNNIQFNYRARNFDDAFKSCLQNITKYCSFLLRQIMHKHRIKELYNWNPSFTFCCINSICNLDQNGLSTLINKLNSLKVWLQEDHISQANKLFVGTIEASQNSAYPTVYLFDIFEDSIPSSGPNYTSDYKGSLLSIQAAYMLYLGITRAMNKLVFIHIENKTSWFLKEIFPELEEQRFYVPYRESELTTEPVNISNYEKHKNDVYPNIIKCAYCGKEKPKSEFNERVMYKKICRECMVNEQKRKFLEKNKKERQQEK